MNDSKYSLTLVMKSCWICLYFMHDHHEPLKVKEEHLLGVPPSCACMWRGCQASWAAIHRPAGGPIFCSYCEEVAPCTAPKHCIRFNLANNNKKKIIIFKIINL